MCSEPAPLAASWSRSKVLGRFAARCFDVTLQGARRFAGRCVDVTLQGARALRCKVLRRHAPRCLGASLQQGAGPTLQGAEGLAAKPPGYDSLVIRPYSWMLLAATLAVLVWSFIDPEDRFTWLLRSC